MNKDAIKAGMKGVASSAAIGILVNAVEFATDVAKEKAEERKDLTEIPNLYSKGYPIKIDQAKTLLEDSGLKIEPIAVRDAHIKYRNFFDLQVVGSKPRQKHKVKPGTRVLVKYVTSEIIEKSQRLFDESEKRKAELKVEKANKRAVQKEKTNKIVGGVVTNIQQGIVDVATSSKNQVNKIAKISKKKNKDLTDSSNDK